MKVIPILLAGYEEKTGLGKEVISLFDLEEPETPIKLNIKLNLDQMEEA